MDGSQVLFFQGIVSPVDSFQEATELWVAHALVQDNDGTCWVRVLNITKDDIMTYQNSRIATLDPIKVGELTLHLKEKDDSTTVENLDFQKHVKLDSKHLTEEQLGEVRLLCQK